MVADLGPSSRKQQEGRSDAREELRLDLVPDCPEGAEASESPPRCPLEPWLSAMSQQPQRSPPAGPHPCSCQVMIHDKPKREEGDAGHEDPTRERLPNKWAL